MGRERKMLKDDGRTRNALKHGCRSNQPVVCDEDPQEWDEHLQGFIDSLNPGNAAEEALAYRAALACWRMYRIDRYEQACCGINHRRAGHHAAGALGQSIRNPFSPPPLTEDELRALAVLPGRQME